MEEEMSNFVKVCLWIFISQYYCYVIGNLVSKGIKRLIFFVPIICLFLLVPLKLSTANLGALIIGLFISWLGSFKLLLFAFGKGPLANFDHSPIPLSQFLLISCLPIETQQNPKKPKKQTQKLGQLQFVIKASLLAILIPFLYHYKDQMHPNVFLVFLCLFIYLHLEAILFTAGAVARAVLGAELEPHFDEPYLATSLQDFWGKRWNLMVSRILRLTIYKPSLQLWVYLVGPEWAPMLAVMLTFVVSGLAHEIFFFYLGRVRPTWEVTLFFVFHGLCLTVEVFLKKNLTDNCRLPRIVSIPLTVGFVMLTASCLFFPQFLRCEADVRMLREYIDFFNFIKNTCTSTFNV